MLVLAIDDGKECLKAIKSNKAVDHITVVMLSITQSPGEIQEFKEMGALFLSKQSTMGH